MSSANISFNSIPSSTRKPGDYFEFNTSDAVNALPGNPQLVLYVGQRLTTGSVPALTAVNVFSSDDAAAYFGRGSIAHLMAKAGLTANNYVALTMIAVDDDAAGVLATGSVVLDGTATANGSVSITVAGVPAMVAVNSNDTPAAIAAALVAQFANQPDLPVTASVDAQTPAKVVISARNKGAASNAIGLSFTSQTDGITGTVTAMSGGQNDPDISDALAAVFAAGHDIIASPFSTTTALTALRSHLDAVSGPMEQRGAIGVAGWPGTLATATTLATSINGGRITLGWHNGSVLPAWQIAAAYAAEIASEQDPAMPLDTLPLAGLDVTDVTARPSRTEQESALWNGVTPFEIGPGNVVQIVRAISTYTVNAQGVADPALLDITTMRTLDYMREAWRQRIALRFPRAKNDAKTAVKVRSELLDVAYKAEALEIIQNVDTYKDAFIVEQDLQNAGQMNAKIPCNVVSGLHVFAAVIDLIL
ncbi:phage tail sheath subtilisin-like domain-containing protein [Paraburkholderia unamae]|uniref:Phage tail sheath gpL-like n=1 Tax=Paraburkholderia unamae TaxID=219649 RepID=A0ABX5KLR7_9BURK|nr:phage tail sheath subtilisin-like domain-containing protein [Paraburkholderia unamae]PVX80053.1 phage tail sheath gpL-like [Paraburkholderia unamae]